MAACEYTIWVTHTVELLSDSGDVALDVVRRGIYTASTVKYTAVPLQ